MGLAYQNLASEVRHYMAEELQHDEKAERVYLGAYLSQTGQGDWSEILKEAIANGTDDNLAVEIKNRGRVNAYTSRRTKTGRYIQAKVPHNANEMLAEGEFNRFYCRALCRFAIAKGIERLEVYRAKVVAEPRSDSYEKIGLLVMPDVMLIDLRGSIGVDLAFGIPAGPNSGLSLRIPALADPT